MKTMSCDWQWRWWR